MVSQIAGLAPPWSAIFGRVPRHLFVPRIVACWPPEEGDAPDGEVAIDSERDRRRWLDLVYSNRLLVVVQDEATDRRSSSSMPSAMARFLHLLDLRDGNTVLEIGTGTGYNAALLSARVGDQLVASVDIDAELIDTARAALARCGFTPTLAVADGFAGYPPRAPYKRIIATCSVPRIPPAWAEQLGPGGVIVAPMSNGMLVGLLRDQEGRLVGRADPSGVSFMPLRSPAWPRSRSWAPLAESAAWSTFPADEELPLSGSALLHARLLLPSVEIAFQDDHHRNMASPADGSWARLVQSEDGERWLAQAGPRRLWDEYRAAVQAWLDLGRPGWERYGLTVEPDGRHRVWVDRPDSDYIWQL
jgi:protein-L-isoaspartate(D-aspartate) O-methyltransferase